MISGTIQDEFQLYLLESEQVASAIMLHCELTAEGAIAWAGGVLVQLLPEAEPGDLEKILPRLEKLLNELKDAKADRSPESLIQRVLPEALPFTLVAEEEFVFGCNCDETRVLSALATLPQADVQEILEKEEVVELSCGYCGKDYRIMPERLRALQEMN